MLTLENIELMELQGEESIVISFTYEGSNMEFKGQIKIGKYEWISSKINQEDDSDMIERLVQQELYRWINQ